MISQKSHQPKKVQRLWYEVDISAQTLGRASTKIANILRGKHKRDFTPHIDGGDFVVAINADQIKVTGKKMQQKLYHHYTGYPGGLRTKAFKDLIVTKPEEIIRQAVFEMIDDNKLRKPMMRRLRIVTGPKHEFTIDKKA